MVSKIFNSLMKDTKLAYKNKDYDKAKTLVLKMFDFVHSINGYSYETETLANINEDKLRAVPNKDDYRSILYFIWHLSRIEDITMNTIMFSKEQVFDEKNYQERLGVPIRDTGNSWTYEEMLSFSNKVNITELFKYREEVAISTYEAINNLDTTLYKKKVDKKLEEKILNKDVLLPAKGILDYWLNRDYFGLLCMPATRHNLVHLNNIRKLRGIK